LLLVDTERYNSNQARKVVEKGKWYRKKGIHNGECVLTGWVDARTILRVIHWSDWATLHPDERLKVVCGVPAMLCGSCTIEYLKD